MGMIGGGRGAFIGGVHRIAAAIDQQVELVCGAFSSTAEKSKASGADLLLPENRCYGTYEEMIAAESKLHEGERMDFVAIVTPNHMHFPAAKAALEGGFHVLCDKPATLDLEEAKELKKIIEATGKLYCLTHNYPGYPMLKQAREMVRSGEVGKIRKVVVEYPQGWLATNLEKEGLKQAEWRTDPKRSGAAGCMGDIGSHAENLAEYVSGLTISELAADLTSFVDGRLLDDDGNVLLRFEGGAKGILHASQISIGCENNLNLRIYGDKGGLEWKHSDANTLLVHRLEKPTEIWRTGEGYLSEIAAANARVPPGHPEGYLEAFANVYRNFANHIRAVEDGTEANEIVTDYPTIDDGIRGMAFIEAVVASSAKNAEWTKLSV
jgi:predicted dehydrogenase